VGWVTLADGQHIYITDSGKVLATGRRSRTQKPALSELSVREVDRIATRAKTVKTLAPITSRKGETITVSIQSNPFHGVLHRSEVQKPYVVRTLVDGELNDARQFASMPKAGKYAASWHRILSREEK
jgi:hypothetical protein